VGLDEAHHMGCGRWAFSTHMNIDVKELKDSNMKGELLNV